MCADDLTLEQLLADPLTRLVMASDRVKEGDLRNLLKRANASRLVELAQSNAFRAPAGREQVLSC